jgi:hypothetical protein
MSEIDPYVVEGNILLFADQLRWETRPSHQEALKRLLIREENQVAREERLELAERMLRDSADLIARQTRRIAELKGNGVDTGTAERALRSFEAIQFLFEEFRAKYGAPPLHDRSGEAPLRREAGRRHVSVWDTLPPCSSRSQPNSGSAPGL